MGAPRSGAADVGAVIILANVALLLIGLGLTLVAVPLARLLYLAASRQREFQADATSALLTRYPAALADALEKIEQAPQQLAANEVVAALCIVHPGPAPHAEGAAGTPRRLAALFATHPPLAERVAVLRGMGRGASAAEYERVSSGPATLRMSALHHSGG